MSNRFVKTLAVLSILSICFSVALCLYSANTGMHMSHHDQVANMGEHLTMARSFNVFVLPLSTILNLLLVLMLVFNYQFLLSSLLGNKYVFETYVKKNKSRLRYISSSPRSPPKY